MGKNIVLIGFMGSGKSTVGGILSSKTSYSIIDCDRLIEKKEGLRISEIFSKYGEGYFRELELSLSSELRHKEDKIISTGGGMVRSFEVMENLKGNGVVVYLKASPERIYENIKNDNTRPLLNVPDKLGRIIELLNEREVYYKKWADIVVDIDNKTPSEVALEIIKRYSKA